jgi:hypothetical protein
MKLCLVFPGIGYGIDKPLLYYSRKIVREHYETVCLSYFGDPKEAKSKKESLETFYKRAYQECCEQLKNINFDDYDEILVISKSIGTAIGEKYVREHQLKVKSVLFTPLTYTYEGKNSHAIAFHGTDDPWASNEDIKTLSESHNVVLYEVDHANHSLETGELEKDLTNLKDIMMQVYAFIKGL